MDIDLCQYQERANHYLDQGGDHFARFLPQVFAANEKLFEDVKFRIRLPKTNSVIDKTYRRQRGSSTRELFSLRKDEGDTTLTVTLLQAEPARRIPRQVLKREIGGSIIDILFADSLPQPFIASAERTGAAIFRKEVDFARNRILEELSASGKALDPYDLVEKAYTSYALPVKANVDFTRQLEDLTKSESFLAKEHGDVLQMFSDIIGGEYRIVKGSLCYVPNTNKRLRLTMDESSSAVRSMLDIGFYLRHVAKQGDMLFIDEPELNLHPGNQRRIARLFARLSKLGIKVFITTHSDYIIKELNTLIMLGSDLPGTDLVCKKFKYAPEEALDADHLKVYTATDELMDIEGSGRRKRVNTLVPMKIDPQFGIWAESFDHEIKQMNEIQNEMLYGGDA